MSYSEIRNRLENTNQLHLLHFWNDLSNEDQLNFLKHLSTVNYEDANDLYKDAMVSLSSKDVKILDDHMEPIPPSQFESEEGSTKEKLDFYRGVGLKEIAEGHVGVLLLAGGQGTRLGIDRPKGMFSIGLPSGKTLFQVQAERIKKLEELAGKKGHITWYIMTSGPTEVATVNFLKSNEYFGLEAKNVVQFDQGLLPCFNTNGKIILEDKNRLALAPDGNGGVYRALHERGMLTDMEKRGIKFLHVHSVDNILVKVADPIFIGYCVDKNADCAAKVVRKSSPSEAVGVVCQVDGRFQVVEYSEITTETANLKNEQGDLVFNAGNICNHFFTVEFLKKIARKKLKLHVAKKKIPFINEQGEKIRPKEINGVKIEKFIFDVFQFSNNFLTWEVPRYTEFSALKNSDDVGKECPATARKDLYSLHKRYVEAAGGKIIGEVVEISPSLSYAGEGLKEKVQGKTFQSPALLDI